MQGDVMSGKIKVLIDKLINERAQGNESVAITTRTKLLLKGIDTKKYTPASEDDPDVIAKIVKIAQEMNISL
jgi:hypothetical protein